jgi:iron complex outermembrane receptor protein
MQVSISTRRFARHRPRSSAFVLALVTSLASAQESMLPEVTVTATPVSSTLPDIDAARASVSTVPGGANVVDAEQYKDGRVSTLSDALQFSPGVFIASRFGAEESRMSIRGSGLQRTFHMRGISLLQDGVPLNLADGSVDFQAIEPLAARYVEVYRGANALQYGSTTLGGAVNFVSPSGLTAAPFDARVEAGSFGYRRAQISAAGQIDAMDWFIAGSQFSQDGYRDHAQQDTQRISGNIGLRLNRDVETRFFMTAVKTNSELPGALTAAEMRRDPRQADPSAISGDQHRNFDLYRLSNLTTVRLNTDQRLEFGAFYSYKSLFHPIFQVLEQKSDDYGVNARFVSERPLGGNRNRFVAGISLAEGTLSDNRFVNVAGHAGARTTETEQNSNNFSLFAENQYYFLPKTAFVLGAQFTEAKRDLVDKFFADGADNSVDREYRHTSPKIGLLHELSPDIQLYGNLSGSYEPPTFGELAGGPTVTPVDAQRATTIEVGTRGLYKQGWGDWRWDLSVYRARVRDELLSLNDANGNPLGTRNADRTIHQGIEAGLEANIGSRWTMRATYLLNDFRFDGDSVYGDNKLAGVPRQVAKAEILFKPGHGFYVGPNVQVASSSWIDHANTLQAGGYAVYGLKFGQQVTPKFSWFVDARNLGDKTYAATTGVIADAAGADSRQFYPGDGRSVYAGVEWKY